LIPGLTLCRLRFYTLWTVLNLIGALIEEHGLVAYFGEAMTIMCGHWQSDENDDVVFISSGEIPNQQVGIYWFINNEVIKEAVSYKKGEPYGEAIQHGNHYEFWQALQPTTESERKLKFHAYDAYPRGRIVFFPSRKNFRVCLDSCVDSDNLAEVLDSFEIEDFDIEIGDDEHYYCAGCNSHFMD
jgi:hypothetical protein